MVLFFSRSRKTEVFAKVLGEMKQMPLYELKSELNDMPTFKFVLKAISLAVRGKSSPVINMPESLPEEIYVCSPIWAGSAALPVKYFLQNAELSNIKVNILLTASTPTHQYVEKAEKLLGKIPCIAGDVSIFATGRGKPDAETLREHLGELM